MGMTLSPPELRWTVLGADDVIDDVTGCCEGANIGVNLGVTNSLTPPKGPGAKKTMKRFLVPS